METLGLIVGVLALGVAAWAALEARRAVRIEQKRDEVALAAGVSAWSAVLPAPTPGCHSIFGVALVNDTSSPVFEVTVRHTVKGAVQDVEIQVLPPGRYFVPRTDTPYVEARHRWARFETSHGVIDTFPRVWEEFELLETPTVPRALTASRKSAVVSVSFRDSANISWLRDEKGMLTRH